MAILTPNPPLETTQWEITLNRVESDDETSLRPDSFSIDKGQNTVIAVEGTGLVRLITLENPVSTFLPSEITIFNHAGMAVISVVNVAYRRFIKPYLDQIRNLLEIGITESDIPDDIILGLAFLRTAELEIYDELGINDQSFDQKAQTDPIYAERIRLSTIYRTAALLLYSYPQLIEERILQQENRYSPYNVEDRRKFLLNYSNSLIEEDVVTPISDAFVLSENVEKRLSF